MARSGEVETAIAEALTGLFPEETVEVFATPYHTREDLAKGRRILVRFATRNIAHEQGPNTTEILVDVGVTGLAGPRQAANQQQSIEQVKQRDDLETLLEAMIRQWVGDPENDQENKLTYQQMAGHSFQEIEQTFQFDADRFYREGIYLTFVRLTYRDLRD